MPGSNNTGENIGKTKDNEPVEVHWYLALAMTLRTNTNPGYSTNILVFNSIAIWVLDDCVDA